MNEVSLLAAHDFHTSPNFLFFFKITFLKKSYYVFLQIFTLSSISICIVSYSSECIDFLSRFFSLFFVFFWQRAAILKVVCFALYGGWVANIMSEHIINLSLVQPHFSLLCFHGSVRFTRIYQGQSRSRRLTLYIPRILYINIYMGEK